MIFKNYILNESCCFIALCITALLVHLMRLLCFHHCLVPDQPSMSQVTSTNSATSSGPATCQDSLSVSGPATDSSKFASTPVVSELPAATTTPTSVGASNATSNNQRAQPSQNPKQKAADTSSGKLSFRELLVKMILAFLNFFHC